MRFEIYILLLIGIAYAIPVCPQYPHNDFVWGTDYRQPVRPGDSLVDNCRNLALADRGVCEHLGNLSNEQKKMLIMDNLVQNSSSPALGESRNWNYALQFTKYPPDNSSTASSGSIRDAWVRVLSLQPSVILNSTGQLFINGTGELYSQAGFSFVVTKQNFGGDCRTDYAVCGYNYAIQNYDNGQGIGSGTKANFSVLQVHNSSNVFQSRLSVNSEYFIHHYHLVRHCVGRFCFTTCDYYRSDDVRNSLSATDNKTAYYYGFNHTEKSIVDSFENGLLDGWLAVNLSKDFGNLKFSVGNSWLRIQSMQYQITYSLPPYNILTPEAFEDKKVQDYNIVVLGRQTGTNASATSEKIHFQVNANGINCSLEVNSHFGVWKNSSFCRELNQSPIISLRLANRTNSTFTIGLRFYDNVSGLALVGKQISVSYAGTMQEVVTDGLGQAVTAFNYTKINSLVRAEFETDFQIKSAMAVFILPPKEPDFFSYALYLFALMIIAYLLYRLARRLMG
ncbi:Uncharacterised protein [Candidatus Anstonella stagnisolia]|nr:Uncharacterised protein [Candidatus Anstonella stagnisolia]